MKPRVLFLDQSGEMGGAEFVLLDIAKYYAESSRVILFSDGPFRERLEEAGVRVDVVNVPSLILHILREGNLIWELIHLPAIFKVASQIAEQASNYDIIYSNTQKALVIGVLVGKLARKPVICDLNDILSRDHFSKSHRWLAVLLANHMTKRVIANSKATAETFIKNGGWGKKICVVHPGSDPALFEPAPVSELDALRKEFGLAGISVVGVFSRLAPWKGQHIVLEALTQLPGVHLLLVGEALFGEDEYARSLREKAVALGIAERVHFLGFRRDVYRLMQLSDIIVHSSIAPEPFGRVVVEGMMSGKPVVAAKAGGVLEIIEDKVTGLLVPPNDAAALGDALVFLLANPNQAKSLAEAGYAAAIKRFSLGTMLDRVEKVIQEVYENFANR